MINASKNLDSAIHTPWFRKNQGVTLVELVVVLAITAIILTAVSSILITSYKSFFGILQMNEDNTVGDVLYEFVCDELSIANKVELIDDSTVIINESTTLSISTEGRLLYNGEDVYGDAFYNGSSVSMQVTKYSINTVQVYITISRNDKNTYSVGSVIRMLNYEFPI